MENLDILNEIHKGAKMGADSIAVVSEKVGDPTFKEDLAFQYDQYQNILSKTTDLIKNYGEVPEDTPMSQKVMGWTGIQMNTLADKSNSQISDLLIQGANMGIIEGVKLLNHNPNMDNNTRNILNEFVKMQENNVERLKKFL